MLAAWAASPARFREDANAEQDHALGGYRDRLVVELAQNAADAAARAGVAGRLRLQLADGVLSAANAGAPLDAAGVQSLSTLRASAKRDAAAVGRFGVGFAAVLAVTDEPAVLSRSGGVRWSRTATAEAVAALPGVAEEARARHGHAPVLRLPFPAGGQPPEDADTVVVLPLRDARAEALARRLLTRVDATLLLALPDLAELTVEVDGARRRLTASRAGRDLLVDDNGERTRWRTSAAGGRLPPELLADRPAEERWRPGWSVLWALPVDDDDRPALLQGVPAVVHAPTPTDEPLSLPALLVASLPLDPSRRHVAPGPLLDFLVARAGETYAALAAGLPPDPAMLTLVPIGLAAGSLDAALRRAALDALVDTPLLPAAVDAAAGHAPAGEAPAGQVERRLRPHDAVAVEDALVPVLAPVVPALVAPGWVGGRREAALGVLGVRRPALAEIVDALGGLERDPAWWARLYAGLEAAVPPGAERDALGALPVPLADGRLVTGPRGLVLPTPDLPPTAAAALGLRVVAPEAVHPLLRTLGATDATPQALLADARVRAAVEASYDEDDPTPIADAVLALVHVAPPAPGEAPWLAELALPGDDGEVYPAGELLLPGGRLAALVDPDAPFGVVAPALVERWGADTLTAVGVLETFALARATDLPVTEDSGLHLDGERAWRAAVAERLPTGELPTGELPTGEPRAERRPTGELPVVMEELVAVRDLELVRPNAWPAALRLLAEPPLRSAVIDPAVVRLPDGAGLAVPAYTRWWLAHHPVLGGRRPAGLRAPDAEPVLSGLFDPAEAGGLDPEFLRALGVVATLADAQPDDLAARLADPARPLDRAQVRAVHRELAHRPPLELAAAVRAVRDDALMVVEPGAAVVVDAPDLLPLVGDRAVVPAPLAEAGDVADALGVDLASELADFPVLSTGRPVDDHVLHEPLQVADIDDRAVRVAWRVVGGVLHVDAGRLAFGLGRGRAWLAGDWAGRHRRTEALRHPDAAPTLRAETDLD